MNNLQFNGYVFLIYTAVYLLLVSFITSDPCRMGVLLFGSFVWFSSFIMSSIVRGMIWGKSTALDILIPVIFQELFRYYTYKMIRAWQTVILRRLHLNSPIFENPHLFSYVIGMGFGMINSAVLIIHVLVKVLDFEDNAITFQHAMNICSTTGLALMLIVLNTFWTVIFYFGLDSRKRLLVCYVSFTNLLFSFMQVVVNNNGYYMCALFTGMVITVTTVALSYKYTHGSLRQITYLFNLDWGLLMGMVMRNRHYIPRRF